MGVIAAKSWHPDTSLWDVQMHFTIDTDSQNGRKLKEIFEKLGAVFREEKKQAVLTA